MTAMHGLSAASADRGRDDDRTATLDSGDLLELNDGQVLVARMVGDDEFESSTRLAANGHVRRGTL